MNFQEIVSGFGFNSISWDVLVFFVFIVGLFLYIFRLSKDKALVMLISTYISLAFVSNIGLFARVFGFNFEIDPVYKIVVFLILIFLFFLSIIHSPLTSVFDQGRRGSWFQVLVIGFLQIGFMFSVIFSLLPVLDAGNLSLFMRSFFIDDIFKVFWMTSPLIAIILIK